MDTNLVIDVIGYYMFGTQKEIVLTVFRWGHDYRILLQTLMNKCQNFISYIW